MDKADQRLKECRDGIDRIDGELIRMLNERVALAAEIGEIKRSRGADYFDPSREAAIMEKIAERNPGPLEPRALQAIFREVISASIALEKRLVIAYLGPEATFTHQAAMKAFGVSLDYRAMKTIADVFDEVARGDADYGVVPIENSTEGAVFHSMDMLVESDLKIVSQVYLPIEHCLISATGLDGVRAVHSKDQALGQCRDWLRRHLPDAELVATASTAGAVRTAAETEGVAAVAGALAAELYGVPVLERGIQDKSGNVTRFLVLGRSVSKPLGGGRDRTSLVVSVNDRVGALADALEPFSKRAINLTKIESRPSRRKAWDYLFFIDFIGHRDDPDVADALAELEAVCPFVKWLGSYPNAPAE